MVKRVIFAAIMLFLGVAIYELYNIEMLNKIIFIRFFRNYAPDYIWALCFYIISVKYVEYLFKKFYIITAIYVIILGIMFELLQLLEVVKGTFDYFDILCYIAAVINAVFLEKIYRRKTYEKSKKCSSISIV